MSQPVRPPVQLLVAHHLPAVLHRHRSSLPPHLLLKQLRHTPAPVLPLRPVPLLSRPVNSRSNFAVPLSTSYSLTFTPAISTSPASMFCNTSITWNNGDLPRSLSGCNSSTSFSNGTS